MEIREDKFIIDYGKEKREAIMSVVDGLKLGDYVVVNSKIIIMKVPENQAIKYLRLVNNVREKNE